jgi:hypothetical protein
LNHSWSLIIADQSSGRTENLTSYEQPSITSISQAAIVDGIHTNGTSVVTLSGQNFGPNTGTSNPIRALYVNENLEGLAGFAYDVSCSILVNHTTIVCETSEGVGLNHTWYVTVGYQKSNASEEVTKYRNLLVYSLLSLSIEGSTLIATDGSDMVMIVGEEFGPVNSLNKIEASY